MNVGQFDQMMAAMDEFASMLLQYYNKLRKAGFDANQALQLTVSLQNEMMKQGRQ